MKTTGVTWIKQIKTSQTTQYTITTIILDPLSKQNKIVKKVIADFVYSLVTYRAHEILFQIKTLSLHNLDKFPSVKMSRAHEKLKSTVKNLIQCLIKNLITNM